MSPFDVHGVLDRMTDVDDQFVKKFRGFDELGSTTC